MALEEVSFRGGEVETGGSKLKGRRGAFEIPCSICGSTISTILSCRICGVLIGDGVGPGVRVIGAGSCCFCCCCCCGWGRGDVALFMKSKPVLLLPFLCLGFEGKPIPPNGFFGGGGGAAACSSIGVGGSGLLTMGGASIGAACSIGLGVAV